VSRKNARMRAPLPASDGARRPAGAPRRAGGPPAPSAYPVAVVPAAALGAALLVVLLGAEAYWLCVPVAVLAAATARSRPAAVLLSLLALGAAAAPPLIDPGLGALPSPVLGLAVPVLSALAVRAVREQLEAGQAELRALARLDPLTGLANRRALDDRLGYEVARHRRHARAFALFVLDLDDFKRVNERFGHAGGDELLADMGRSLRAAVREQDTVARLGGDEFCVLAPETDREEAARLEGRLREAVARATVGFEGMSGSVGLAVFPDDGQSGAAMMAAADAAQAADKRRRRKGRGRLPTPAAA
jgi:diguanylate cyclase (GGDEF)-like protein